MENHADTLKWLGLYLEDSGHVVLTAKTMHEALESVPGANADVLISDIGLPDGDGWELLRALRLPHSIYAIAISGLGMTEDRARSKAAGFRQHLLKPINVIELDRALEEAASEKAA